MMNRRLYPGRDYRRAQNIEELREIARRRLPNFSFEYVEGGADDELTLLRNRSVFESITLRAVGTRDLCRDFFGVESKLPFMIGPSGFSGLLTHQGDLRLADAEIALHYGVDALVLSNHGGRQLDGVVSAMETLPQIARIVRGRLQVFLDGGFRRGSDIAKALLLGADGVLIGRAGLYGLAAGKGPGASHAIDILRTEQDRTVGLLGCSSLAELQPELIHDPHWRTLAEAVRGIAERDNRLHEPAPLS